MKLFRLSLPLYLMLPFMVMVVFTGLSHMIPVALAADAPSLTDALLALIGDIKDKAVVAVVLVHVFQILRTHEVFGVLGKIGLQGKGLQIAIAVITALGFCVDAYAKNGNILQALIEGLFTSGGAMLIFDASKASQVAAMNTAVAGK